MAWLRLCCAVYFVVIVSAAAGRAAFICDDCYSTNYEAELMKWSD